MKTFWIACGLFGVLFTALLLIRLDVPNFFLSKSKDTPLSLKDPLSGSDAWMNIFQDGRKIGYSHTTFSKQEKGYHLKETMHIRINTMGMAQDISLNMMGRLNLDYTLSSFDFVISSGRFNFTVEGTVSGDMLSIKTQSTDDASHRMDIRLKDKIYVTSGIIQAIRYAELVTGKTFTFQIYDPLSMSQEPLYVKVVGEEDILNMGETKKAKKLEMAFKGASQQIWIGETGEILREKGLLGISFERTSRDNALLASTTASSQDMTKAASVLSNVNIEDAPKLTRLELEIDGVQNKAIRIEGGRQKLQGNILVITKEILADLKPSAGIDDIEDIERKFIEPGPFIQSDHPKIKLLVSKIISQDDKPLVKAEKLVDWIHTNIEKRPVLSLPDAVSTLTHRVGDCNEHAVLLAALARAAGIPAKVEAGFVYLNGRFYYHAWNLLYLGEWITVDSLFNQIPADVTHVRLTSGKPNQQLDLINIIGKIKLRVIKQTR